MRVLVIAYIAAGLVVPVATFVGVGLWWLRAGPLANSGEVARPGETELVRSAIATHHRLDELRHQISDLGEEWERRDRDLADRISRLISLAEQPATGNPPRDGA